MNLCKISFGHVVGPKAPVHQSRLHVGQTDGRGCVKEVQGVPTEHPRESWDRCHREASQAVALAAV